MQCKARFIPFAPVLFYFYSVTQLLVDCMFCKLPHVLRGIDDADNKWITDVWVFAYSLQPFRQAPQVKALHTAQLPTSPSVSSNCVYTTVEKATSDPQCCIIIRGLTNMQYGLAWPFFYYFKFTSETFFKKWWWLDRWDIWVTSVQSAAGQIMSMLLVKSCQSF